jgi:hypothetical protein
MRRCHVALARKLCNNSSVTARKLGDVAVNGYAGKIGRDDDPRFAAGDPDFAIFCFLCAVWDDNVA